MPVWLTREYETLFDPWFRGQRVAQWPLRPGLYRYALGNDEADLRLTCVPHGDDRV